MARIELVRKGESRCYVYEEHHVEEVRQIVKELDDFEFDYMPTNWIVYWDRDSKKVPPLIYNGKFDINVIDLKIACAKKGIAISVLSTNIENEIY